MGSRSNFYFIDGNGVLRGALRALEDTRRELQIGKPWANPESAPPDEGMDRWAEAEDGELLREIGRSLSAVLKARMKPTNSSAALRAFCAEAPSSSTTKSPSWKRAARCRGCPRA